MSVHKPEYPAVPDYPTEGPHTAALATAQETLLKELASPDSEWESQGERDGVKLWKKTDAADPNAVPTVKGECLVEGVTSEAFLSGVVGLSSTRKLWDPRFETGHVLTRYSRTTFAFYSQTKGLGWLIYPRDIVGVQQNHLRADGSPTGERLVVQTSIKEDELAPEQSGKTRATLVVSGWRFVPEGDNLRVTYVVNVKLNGSIPLALVAKIATETPLCTARARDAFYQYGHAPVSRVPADSTTIFQTESFSDPPLSENDPHPRAFRCSITTGQPGDRFEIIYDLKRMYKPEGGVKVEVEGEGVEVENDENGTVAVKSTEAGKRAVIVLSPK
ncbi:hypothetical protein JCM10207_000661 [Rhodosporidiobolus poonsookiae]